MSTQRLPSIRNPTQVSGAPVGDIPRERRPQFRAGLDPVPPPTAAADHPQTRGSSGLQRPSPSAVGRNRGRSPPGVVQPSAPETREPPVVNWAASGSRVEARVRADTVGAEGGPGDRAPAAVAPHSHGEAGTGIDPLGEGRRPRARGAGCAPGSWCQSGGSGGAGFPARVPTRGARGRVRRHGPVVKLHDRGLEAVATSPTAGGAVSLMPVVPPVRVRVNFWFAASAGVGSTIHRLAAVASLVMVVAITPPSGPFSTTVDVVTFVTGSLKVTRMLAVLVNPVALMAGVRPVTLGAALVTGAVGVTPAALCAEAALVPTALVAATVNL